MHSLTSVGEVTGSVVLGAGPLLLPSGLCSQAPGSGWPSPQAPSLYSFLPSPGSPWSTLGLTP